MAKQVKVQGNNPRSGRDKKTTGRNATTGEFVTVKEATRRGGIAASYQRNKRAIEILKDR